MYQNYQLIQLSFRRIQCRLKPAKWQTFEKPENKRQMYGCQFTQASLLYICLLFLGFANVCNFACFWLKLFWNLTNFLNILPFDRIHFSGQQFNLSYCNLQWLVCIKFICVYTQMNNLYVAFFQSVWCMFLCSSKGRLEQELKVTPKYRKFWAHLKKKENQAEDATKHK